MVRVSDEVAFVGIESEDETAVPVGVYITASFNDAADGGVAIFEGVLSGTGEGADGFVQRYIGGELAAVNEHFSTRADGGGESLHQHFMTGKGWQGCLADFDVVGLKMRD